MKQFEVNVIANYWIETDKTNALIVALGGETLDVLHELTDGEYDF